MRTEKIVRLDIVVHGYNLSVWEVEQKDCFGSEDSPDCILNSRPAWTME